MRAIAALLPAMALALSAPVAVAQDQPLPSVSDYRLPPPQPRATRASGPVDPSNPVVPVRRGETSAAAPAAPASAAASPAAARSANPSPRPSPRPSASASRAAEPRRAEEPARPAAESRERPESRESEPRAAESAQPTPAPTPEATSPEPSASATPPVQWNVHSAKEAEGSPIWPWLVGIVLLLASNGYLLMLLMRRRQRKAADEAANAAWEQPEEAPALARIPAPQPEPQPAVPAVAAEPLAAVPAEPILAKAEPAPAQPTPPALELVVNPIEVTLAARQLSATLMNTVLNYELVVANLSDEAMGPIAIAGDMIGAHASLPTRAQLEIMGNGIEPHHRHPILRPGEWAKFSGEFRLPLAAITPIRSGRASLFVPLARFRVEVWRNGAPPLVINRTFVIGETPDNPEAALKPFRLDLGPRLYAHIGQREVAATA